jgi:uncharacterized Ntn-hydrolase superfamily protein
MATFQLGQPFHTFTMIGRCEREGLLGICLTSSPISVGARCPFIKANVAAVSTQAYSDPGLGPLALRLLELGYSPEHTLKEMHVTDEWAEYRQNGIVDRHGRSAVFTGSKNLDWKGHLNGPNYVAMGNYLTSDKVVEAMAKAFVDSRGQILEERLMGAIEAGKDAGGERGGHLSSALIVFGRDTYGRTDLRVDMYPTPSAMGEGDAVNELRRIFNEYKPLIPYYEERPRNPLLESWRGWHKKHGASS